LGKDGGQLDCICVSHVGRLEFASSDGIQLALLFHPPSKHVPRVQDLLPDGFRVLHGHGVRVPLHQRGGGQVLGYLLLGGLLGHGETCDRVGRVSVGVRRDWFLRDGSQGHENALGVNEQESCLYLSGQLAARDVKARRDSVGDVLALRWCGTKR